MSVKWMTWQNILLNNKKNHYVEAQSQIGTLNYAFLSHDYFSRKSRGETDSTEIDFLFLWVIMKLSKTQTNTWGEWYDHLKFKCLV